MDLLGSFIALDFETTGIDPLASEVIEIAAVRVEGWQVVDTLQTLVQPRTMPSPSIERLTGITAAELRGQPSLEIAMERLKQFIGTAPLISHNAEFETSRLCLSIPPERIPPVFDTVQLGRIALPRLPNHRLGTLVEAFGFENPEEHRALGDTHTLVEVFRALVETLKAFPHQRLTTLVAIARSVPTPEPPLGSVAVVLEEVLKASALAAFAGTTAPMLKGELLVSLTNTLGSFDDGSLEPNPEPEPISPQTIADTLGPKGIVRKRLPSYEVRHSQVQMAEEVTTTLNDGGVVLCEAGTGTGKSLAYLIPAVEWAVQNGRRVVISTHTKNLQEQLYYKDLPLLAEMLEIPVRAVVLKGKSNYICLSQWHEEVTAGSQQSAEESRALLLPLVTWVDETASGDLEENGAFQTMVRFVPGAHRLAARLSSEGKPCSRKGCQYYEKCYVTRIRRAAQQAHIIIVNHSLLFSDLAADHGVIGPYEDLIIDEAHTLEETATDYLGMELSLPAINDVLDRLNSTRGHTTLLSRLRGSLRRASIDEQTRKSFEVQLGTTGQSIELVRERAEALFAAAKNEIPRPDIASNYPTKRQFDAENNVFGEIMEKRDDLVASCRNLKESIGTLVLWLRDLPLGGMPARDEILADAELRQADVAELSQRIVVLTEAKTEEDVYWYELPANSDEGRLRFLSAPLHVGKRLQEAFYPGLRSLIMTSATLSIAGKFNYFQDRLGLEPGSVRTLAVKSPFDYGKQVRVALPGWFPEPRSGAEFERAVIALLGALIPRVRRGTLVLFTSYGMLNNAYSSLRDTFAEEGILLLGQKVDGSRSSITNRFRQDRESVLFGTDSFWQGIDVPGESLELLIIVKLPFSVPSEPLEIAQSNALRAAGKDPFLYLTVPKAAVRFRQGFGRLIRHRNDKGAVLILDTRVVRASYGRAFHRSLPTAHTVYRSQEELIRALEDWFRNGTPADAVGTDQE